MLLTLCLKILFVRGRASLLINVNQSYTDTTNIKRDKMPNKSSRNAYSDVETAEQRHKLRPGYSTGRQLFLNEEMVTSNVGSVKTLQAKSSHFNWNCMKLWRKSSPCRFCSGSVWSHDHCVDQQKAAWYESGSFIRQYTDS